MCSLPWTGTAPPSQQKEGPCPAFRTQGLPSFPFPMHMRRRNKYLVGERLHLDSIPRHCLAWVVCSLHQHLLTQLGQPALHHTASAQARRPSQEKDPGQATLTALGGPSHQNFSNLALKQQSNASEGPHKHGNN